MAITITPAQRDRLEAAMRALRLAKNALRNRKDALEQASLDYEIAHLEVANATSALQVIQDELLGA